MAKLYISKRKNSGSVLVDINDLEYLSRFEWYLLHWKGKAGSYAVTLEKTGWKDGRRPRTLYMHRMLMKPPEGMLVDHVNGNGLDNRRANLRLATRAQNAVNSRAKAGSSSRFKGVSGGVWYANARMGEETFPLGKFQTEEEAARAYDAWAVTTHGEFACLNFPEEHGLPARNTTET